MLSVCLDDANYLLINKALNEILYTVLRLYEEFPNAGMPDHIDDERRHGSSARSIGKPRSCALGR